MAPKRKRGIAQSTTSANAKANKRARGAKSHPHGDDVDYDQDYRVRSIIGEKGDRYLIDWEDDPITGKKYPPSWEPKENANEAAILDWQEQKKKQKTSAKSWSFLNASHAQRLVSTNGSSESTSSSKRKRSTGSLDEPRSSNGTSSRSSNGTSSPIVERKARRPRRIISSSPTEKPHSTDSDRTPRLAVDDPSVQQSSLIEIGESQPQPSNQIIDGSAPSSSPASSEAAPRTGRYIAVQLSEPPSSYDAGAYERITQRSVALQDVTETQTQLSSSASSPNSARKLPKGRSASPFALASSTSGRELLPGFTLTETGSTTEAAVVGPEVLSLSTSVSTQESQTGLPTPVEERSSLAGVTSARSDRDSAPPPSLPLDTREGPPFAPSTQTSVLALSASVNTREDIAKDSGDVTRAPDPSRGLGHGASLKGIERGNIVARASSPEALALVAEEQTSGHHSSLSSGSSFPFLTQLPGGISLASSHPGHQQSPSPHACQSPDLHSKRTPPARSRSARAHTQRLSERHQSPVCTPSPAVSAPSQPPRSTTEKPASTDLLQHGETSPTNSERTMDPTPSSSLNERLREMRARNRAKFGQGSPPSAIGTPAAGEQPASAIPPSLTVEIAASIPAPAYPSGTQDGLRSPSVIPAAEPEEIVTKEDMNTSERYPSLLPQQPSNVSVLRPSGSKAGNEASQETRTALDAESTNAFLVPIFLVGHQRFQYSAVIYYHDKKIQEYLANHDSSPEAKAAAQEVVHSAEHVIMHPDLNNPETATQYIDDATRQARWDVDCSAKFRFLESFFDYIRAADLRVAILAQNPRICDILFTFFEGLNVSSRDGSDSSRNFVASKRSSTAIILNSLDQDGPTDCDAIIALDGTLKHDQEQIRALRKRPDGTWVPILTLVVPKSVEHIQRSLLPTLSDDARLRTVVSAIVKLKNDAGRPEQEGQLAPQQAAQAAANFLVSSDGWTLAGLGVIDDLDSQTESEHPVGPDEDPVLTNEDPSSTALKRPRDNIDVDRATTSPIAKRPRADDILPGTVNLQEIEITHVSDSLGQQTQPFEPDVFSIDPAAELQSLHEQQLSELVKVRENRIDEYAKALEDLQYRHEEQRQALIMRTKERDEAIIAVQRVNERMTRAETQNAALRTERTELKAALEDANQRLLNSNIPEQRQIEEMRAALEGFKLQAAKADKRTEAAERDLAYTRDLYQTSSSKAQELAQLNEGLQARVAVLEQLASGEQARAHDASNATYDKALASDVRKLRQMLRDREAALKFKDEELARLKEAGRGRISTRNSSVPRSPRIGSRQTSPAGPGAGSADRPTRSHPLRNSNASE